MIFVALAFWIVVVTIVGVLAALGAGIWESILNLGDPPITDREVPERLGYGHRTRVDGVAPLSCPVLSNDARAHAVEARGARGSELVFDEQSSPER